MRCVHENVQDKLLPCEKEHGFHKSEGAGLLQWCSQHWGGGGASDMGQRQTLWNMLIAYYQEIVKVSILLSTRNMHSGFITGCWHGADICICLFKTLTTKQQILLEEKIMILSKLRIISGINAVAYCYRLSYHTFIFFTCF